MWEISVNLHECMKSKNKLWILTKGIAIACYTYTYTYNIMQLCTLCAGWLYLLEMRACEEHTHIYIHIYLYTLMTKTIYTHIYIYIYWHLVFKFRAVVYMRVCGHGGALSTKITHTFMYMYVCVCLCMYIWWDITPRCV